MSWRLAGRPLRRVLITRLRYLGDIVMSTVVVDALRRGDGGMEIGYLCEADHGAVLANHEDLTSIHLLDATRRGRDARARQSRTSGFPQANAVGNTWATARMLRAADYDLAVDLFFNPRSAWLLRLSGIPLRIGGTRSWRRRLYTHTVVDPPGIDSAPGFAAMAPGAMGAHLCRLAPLHHVESGLDFIPWLEREYAGRRMLPALSRTPLTELAGEALRGTSLEITDPFLLLAPGATWPTKEWPIQRWRELVAILRETLELPLLILAPPGAEDRWFDLTSDMPLGEKAYLPALDLASALSLVVPRGGWSP